MLFFSFVSSTANSSLLGGGGGKCLVFYNMFIVTSFLSTCEMFGGFFVNEKTMPDGFETVHSKICHHLFNLVVFV